MIPTEPVKIYVFNASSGEGLGGGCLIKALCECGDFIASHFCSSEAFAAHDMGLSSTWKHNLYRAHIDEQHGGGDWSLIRCPTADVRARRHEALEAAYAKHVERYPERE